MKNSQNRSQLPQSFRFDAGVIDVIDKVHELTGYHKTAFVAEAILQYAPTFVEIHARKRLDAKLVAQSLKTPKG